jgi:hypothetical protein
MFSLQFVFKEVLIVGASVYRFVCRLTLKDNLRVVASLKSRFAFGW